MSLSLTHSRSEPAKTQFFHDKQGQCCGRRVPGIICIDGPHVVPRSVGDGVVGEVPDGEPVLIVRVVTAMHGDWEVFLLGKNMLWNIMSALTT